MVTNRRQEHTKPTVGRRAVFVRRPTKFSQCVPYRRLKLVLISFCSANSSSTAQNGRATWQSAVERRFGVSAFVATSSSASACGDTEAEIIRQLSGMVHNALVYDRIRKKCTSVVTRERNRRS
ncbi:hypothetical protein DPX16_8712 [Anabarilius grahami]|uniref:Uncharacterized protein n=1 Tax=Anabarilius grahami TaxID=495550 RepID=A0A3N0YEP5_ANAGA|nr:hypothetical protein DPX16_8712 [Anabarilius grahami]